VGTDLRAETNLLFLLQSIQLVNVRSLESRALFPSVGVEPFELGKDGIGIRRNIDYISDGVTSLTTIQRYRGGSGPAPDNFLSVSITSTLRPTWRTVVRHFGLRYFSLISAKGKTSPFKTLRIIRSAPSLAPGGSFSRWTIVQSSTTTTL
jgi:hypothetical protein